MKMTLEDAKHCISGKKCDECRLNNYQDEFDCREIAFEIAESCINYVLIGKKLSHELEEKER